MPAATPRTFQRMPLGRGLDALLPSPKAGGEGLAQIPVDRVDPNPVQPRTSFDGDALRGLAASIREDGVLQPILVRPAGDRYTLVVGERRLRACRLIDRRTIPAVVREIDPDKLLEITLVENIQRQDLNPIEIALALEKMQLELNLVHEELAARTGMSRASITNHLRLLKLSQPVRKLVREGKLQMGHARALVPIETARDQESLARHAKDKGLSVRDVERMVRKLQRPPRKTRIQKVDANVAAAIDKLERYLQAPVRLRQRGRKGRLEIEYSSAEELAAIYDRIVAAPTG